MTDGGHGIGVEVVGIGKDRTLFEQARQTVMVLVAEPQEVVVAELVDDDGNHQAGFAGQTGGNGPERGCYKKKKN